MLSLNRPSGLRHQQGFTLVEIAIVLVIIGLLLGGILKGQELISSARVRNMANQNSGIQAAYYGFIDRYREVPGDMEGSGSGGVCNVISNQAAGCAGGATTTIAGDGNGQLDEEAWDEGSALWAHLSAANFIQGNYVGGATDVASYQDNAVSPINVYNGHVMLTRTDEYTLPTGSTPSTRLALAMGINVPVDIQRELDLKIDDGLPQTGVMVAAPTSAPNLGAVNQSAADCVDTTQTPPIWDINADSQQCAAVYLY